jgi:hypothetical protein
LEAIQKPHENCYWIIPKKLLAGEYPRTKERITSRSRIEAMFRDGITRFIDLTTKNDNLLSYEDILNDVSGGAAKRLAFPIPDLSIPADANKMIEILDAIDTSLCEGHGVYIHCWGGVGRTGTVVGCWLKRHFDGKICQSYLGRSKSLDDLWKECPKSFNRPHSPETIEQKTYVDHWQENKQSDLTQDHRFWTFMPAIKSEDIDEDFIAANNAIADAAREGDWDSLFKQFEKWPELINYPRILGEALYTPLHQAARNGAPARVVDLLLSLGAFRTLRNKKGEIPLDTALRAGHQHLFSALKPHQLHPVKSDHLMLMTRHFHELVHERIKEFAAIPVMRLPILDPLTEMNVPILWCPIPGMYGGFNLQLKRSGDCPQIIADSWSRVVGGSGQKHLIMPQGYVQLEDGTV